MGRLGDDELTMTKPLSFLYRGPLESCNYGCNYCPFAKKKDTRAELLADRKSFERFIDWIEKTRVNDRVSVLVTPWGEGLIRRWYQEGLIRLSRLPHVERAAIQTNLSCDIEGWVDRAEAQKLGIWATYHPEWTPREAFLDKIRRLHARGVNVSCGVVGLHRFTSEIARLRDDLPEGVYLWINAAKSYEEYGREEIARYEAIDPLFAINTRRHPSKGKACRAGESVVSVDGDGDVRRCHFIDEVIGNLYDGSFDRALKERPCTNDTCGCHIGYVHLDELGLYDTFRGHVLERIPAEPIWTKRRLAIVS